MSSLSTLTKIELGLLASLVVALLYWVAGTLYRRNLKARFFHDGTHFPNKRSRFAKVDGINIHYVVEGKGPDVLLLHGIGSNIYCWRHLITLLSEDFRVWAADLKGFGLSDKPAHSKYGLRDQAHTLLDFLKFHRAQKTIIVGNSMGGAIGLEMALQNAEQVSHLVLIDSTYDPQIIKFDLRWLKHLLHFAFPFLTPAVMKQLLRRVYGSSMVISEEMVHGYLAPYLRHKESIRSFVEAFEALTDPTLLKRLGLVQPKTLILWGERDRLVPVRFGETLHRLIPGSKFRVHPTAGHHLQEEDPQWVLSQIRDFYRDR